MKKRLAGLFSVLLFLSIQINAQHFGIEKSAGIYKEIDGHKLEMIIYKPVHLNELKLPAIVFFFGGGWVNGDPGHFELQAEYLASRGLIVICPDYRTKSRHNTSPFESVKDARSLILYLKQHGAEMGIDTEKIVAAGGSAGGHLAAGTAMLNKINESDDDLAFSPVPFALILFNPVVDTGKNGYGQEKMEGRAFEISPVHSITEGLPPTLIMHGKKDTTVPYENVVRFKQLMKQEGNDCILKGYYKQSHGFFNYSTSQKYFRKTLQKTETFLEDYNLLKGSSWVRQYVKQLK
jgi:acetyl esterase/lipase